MQATPFYSIVIFLNVWNFSLYCSIKETLLFRKASKRNNETDLDRRERRPVLLPRKEVIHPHLPVRIPCYDLTPIIKFTLGQNKFGRRVPLTFMVWRAVCTRPGNVFTAACWSAITSDSDFKRASFSPLSELGPVLMGFAPDCSLAARCTGHCSAFLAPDVRLILTWHHPLLPPRYRGSLARKIQLTTRVALVDGLNQTSHDTSWRRPCKICHSVQ